MSVIGNTNASRGREWRDALRKAWTQFEDKGQDIKRGEALYKIGRVVVKMALAGDMDAIREIGNRADGKAVQVQEIAVDINARFVVEQYRAKLGNDDDVRIMLKTAGALNLIPVLEQLILEQIRPEHETIEHAQLEHQPA